MFAKLFGPDDDQVLVVKATNEHGQPVINISCEALTYVGADTMGVIVQQTVYLSEHKCDFEFAEMAEHAARHMADQVRAALAAQLDKEKGQLATRRDLS